MEKRLSTIINPDYYHAPNRRAWSGRIDGTEKTQLRWHQIIKTIDLNQEINLVFENENKTEHVVFLGFACDEGVQRNQGRIGAAQAPEALRKACANFPLHTKIHLHDAGDIICRAQNLEQTQEQLAIAVQLILQAGAFPILLGGGHEIAFGHYKGISAYFPQKKIGIVNFDAHFDNRMPAANGANSGTSFWQIQEMLNQHTRLHYLAIGIQKSANTKELFTRANQSGSTYILDKEFNILNKETLHQTIESFCEEVDGIYLSIDMDVFSASFAPGVSAPNAKGIAPDYLFDACLDQLFRTGKVISVDFAEVNPVYDVDHRTEKLAARLIFDTLERK